MAHCGADYRRLRLGIGRPDSAPFVHNYVLGNFAKADMEWLQSLLDRLVNNIDLLLQGKESPFMNKMSVHENRKG